MATGNCCRREEGVRRVARNCCVVALAFALLPAVRGSAADLIHSSQDDRVRAYEWFATLEYPDVAKLPFVRVATGNWTQSGNEGPKARYEHGFLLSEEGNRFSILTLELATHKFTKTGPVTVAGRPIIEHQIVDFEPADLAQFATGVVEKNENTLKEDHRHTFEAQVDLFFLSLACARQGLDPLAVRLFDCAASIPDERGAKHAGRRALRDQVADEIAHAEMWRTVIAFGDLAISRQDLLDRFQWIIKNFPHSEHLERAKAFAALLAMMIVEDHNHPDRPTAGPEWEKLDHKEQVAELIFQLRDQNGQQLMQPGGCHIFFTPSGGDDTPAHRLVKIGFDAVPQLIDALSDPRPTRSVGFHRNFYFSHHVLTVGDCALQILERIAGRSFYKRKHTAGYMAKDGVIGSVAEAAREWYAEVLKKGEKQTLIDAATSGDEQSIAQAKRLLEKYPDDALPVLIAATRAAKTEFSRNQLIQLVEKVPGEPAQEFLLEELRNGPFASARLLAATALERRGRPEGVATMLAHWRAKHLPDPARPPGSSEPDPERADTHWVALFLVVHGRVEGVTAVADRLADLPVSLRLNILEEIAAKGNIRPAPKVDGDAAAAPPPPAEKEDAPLLRAATLKFLIAALDDTEQQKGQSGSWYGKWYTDPRVCDFAGLALNYLDPERYPFDLAAPQIERDRSRVVLKNNWLKDQGLPELPLPAEPSP